MARRITPEDSFTFACIADAAQRRIILDHPRSELSDRLVATLAYGIGTALAHEDRLGDHKGINAQVKQVAAMIKKAVLQSRRYDELNNKTMFASLFDNQRALRRDRSRQIAIEVGEWKSTSVNS